MLHIEQGKGRKAVGRRTGIARQAGSVGARSSSSVSALLARAGYGRGGRDAIGGGFCAVESWNPNDLTRGDCGVSPSFLPNIHTSSTSSFLC